MMSVLQALAFVNLFAAALGAGGQVFCLRTLIPARRAWPPDMGARVHQDAMTALPDSYMKPASAIALVTALLIAGLEAARPGPALVLMLLGAAGQAVNAVISARWEWPINREIVGWGSGPVPAERYSAVRRTWDEKHLWRTIASSFALACFILACLFRRVS